MFLSKRTRQTSHTVHCTLHIAHHSSNFFQNLRFLLESDTIQFCPTLCNIFTKMRDTCSPPPSLNPPTTTTTTTPKFFFSLFYWCASLACRQWREGLLEKNSCHDSDFTLHVHYMYTVCTMLSIFFLPHYVILLFTRVVPFFLWDWSMFFLH